MLFRSTTGNVYLTAVTGISEVASGTPKITTGTLGMLVTGTGDIDVNNANLVTTLGAKTASGNIKYTNNQNLNITTVAANTGGNFAGTTNGLDTSATTGKTVDVKVSTGSLTLNSDVTTNTTGNVYLTAVTGISEVASGTPKITTGTLGMLVTGTGDIDVNNANLVTTLGAKTASGNIKDRKSTRLNSSHSQQSRMPSSA